MKLQDLITNENAVIHEVLPDVLIVNEDETFYAVPYTTNAQGGVDLTGEPVEVEFVPNNDGQSGSSTNNEGEPEMAKLSVRQRKQIVDSLVANCACQDSPLEGTWNEEDRPLLNRLSDKKLIKQYELVTNAMDSGSDDSEDTGQDDHDGDEEPETNDEESDSQEEGDSVDQMGGTGPFGTGGLPVRKINAGEQQNNSKKPGYGTGAPKMPGMRKVGSATTNAEEKWLKTAPPAVRAMVRNAKAIHNQQVNDCIDIIMNAQTNTFTEKQLRRIAANEEGLEQLVAMANLTGNSEFEAPQQRLAPSYAGAAGAPIRNQRLDNLDEAPLVPPTVNYADMCAPGLAKRLGIKQTA